MTLLVDLQPWPSRALFVGSGHIAARKVRLGRREQAE